MKPQATQVNSKHTTLSDTTTGGLVCEPLSKITSKDVEPANNLRSTDTPLNQPLSPPKGRKPPDHLRIAPWTSSPTSHRTKNFDSILVVVDQGLSKGVILIPCNKTITAEETAKLLLNHLYKRFGLPDKIISDHGPQFASKAFVELLKLLGIKPALSTAYHPQIDGTTERVNQEIEAYLSIYCTTHPDDWLSAIHIMEFTHNNQRHADRQKTPFELMFGDSPIAIPLSFENTKFPMIEGEEVYEVENILKHRKRGRTYQYYVKWKGYPISKALWEPEEVFSDDGELLTQYKQRYQL